MKYKVTEEEEDHLYDIIEQNPNDFLALEFILNFKTYANEIEIIGDFGFIEPKLSNKTKKKVKDDICLKYQLTADHYKCVCKLLQEIVFETKDLNDYYNNHHCEIFKNENFI